MKSIFSLFLTLLLFTSVIKITHAQNRQRARDLGVKPGILTPGPFNAITDVKGVKVGHHTMIEGDHIRTGITAILPHDGNLYRNRVPAAVYVGNGFGKALGFTQVQELGEIETPIGLTNTLSIFTVASGIADFVLNHPDNQNVRSVNPVVGETNDGWLNDIRRKMIRPEDVNRAIETAENGVVEEGNVGAGTGTRALGFKGGIGTSSRVLPEERGGYTVGVIVQSNFGGILTINGAPVGEELGNYYLAGEVADAGSDNRRLKTAQKLQGSGLDHLFTEKGHHPNPESHPITGSDRMTSYDFDVDGSVMIVVATDAPVTSRNLERLAKRAFLGVARVGGFASNGSGDYVIAFSTHPDVRRNIDDNGHTESVTELKNAAMSPLFLAAVEATEEAIL
ncbi:MAG: P1 family peptidase, partial [Balneolaceae bacterium]